jgi:hypothetical protein
LSKQSPRLPIETSIPTLRQRRVKISDVYWADSSGPRNTSTMRSCDGEVEGASV